jgi:hypothetical protein
VDLPDYQQGSTAAASGRYGSPAPAPPLCGGWRAADPTAAVDPTAVAAPPRPDPTAAAAAPPRQRRQVVGGWWRWMVVDRGWCGTAGGGVGGWSSSSVRGRMM